MLHDNGQEESGLDKLARVGFDTLGLQTYLTAGEKESRAWTIRKGAVNTTPGQLAQAGLLLPVVVQHLRRLLRLQLHQLGLAGLVLTRWGCRRT